MVVVRYSKPMKQEKPIPWGLVVESDEVYSERTGRWYRVDKTVRMGARVKVWAAGQGKAWPLMEARDKVLVRRGPTGDAVDMIQIIFSGETL